jgi:hypothetical protein
MPQVQDDRARVWTRWLAFLAQTGHADDPYLSRLDLRPELKPIIIGGFAQALRSGELQQRRKKEVVRATVRNNIDHLVQTFRDARQKNPTLDPDGSFSSLLSGQLAGYGSLDPPAKRQKAISVNVLLTLYDLAESPSDLATADLAMGAFFFACRSCEYLKVTGARRTKTLQVGDIQFRKGKTVLPHSSPNLHLADTVSLTFRDQKNRDKMATRSAWSTEHARANPVVAWANIVRRVRSLPNAGDRTHVFQCRNTQNKTGAISDAIMIQKLRAAVKHLGVHSLGYSPADVGTHSIRSGAAMALVLSHHAAWRIMLAGRWKSSSFLLYIREQVQAFSKGVSERMLDNPDFYHVPDIDNLPTSHSSATLPSPLETNLFTGGASNYTMLDISFFG